MMYTIDLLKGHGIPIRSRRGGLLIISATIAVPVIIAMIFYTQYLLNSIDINRMQISLKDWTKKIEDRKGAVESLTVLERQTATMRDCLGDVSTAIGRNMQWSPILRLIVENMPASTVINKLDVSLVTQSKQVPDKSDPQKLINVPQNLRKLQISLFDYSKSGNGEPVHDFIRILRSSKEMAGRVDDVRIAAQEHAVVQGVEVTRYDIDCVFKPQG